MPKLMMIKDHFYEECFKRGMTAKDVADKAGITKQAVYNISNRLNGATPGTAKKIAEVLEVPIMDLFEIIKEEQK